MSIKKEINAREGTPISFDMINFITGLGKQTHLVVFDDDLAKKRVIETNDVFAGKRFSCMLVSQKDENINHWVCLRDS